MILDVHKRKLIVIADTLKPSKEHIKHTVYENLYMRKFCAKWVQHDFALDWFIVSQINEYAQKMAWFDFRITCASIPTEFFRFSALKRMVTGTKSPRLRSTLKHKTNHTTEIVTESWKMAIIVVSPSMASRLNNKIYFVCFCFWCSATRNTKLCIYFSLHCLPELIRWEKLRKKSLRPLEVSCEMWDSQRGCSNKNS